MVPQDLRVQKVSKVLLLPSQAQLVPQDLRVQKVQLRLLLERQDLLDQLVPKDFKDSEVPQALQDRPGQPVLQASWVQ